MRANEVSSCKGSLSDLLLFVSSHPTRSKIKENGKIDVKIVAHYDSISTFDSVILIFHNYFIILLF